MKLPRPSLVLIGLPLLSVCFYAAVVTVRFPSLLRAVFDNADIASGPVIGQQYDAAPRGAEVVLGNFPWYTHLWFELATRSFPFHRELWEVGPWVTSLVAIALLAWATAAVAGGFAGAITGFVLACANARLLPIMFAGTLHGAAVANACLLGAFLVLLVRRGGRIGTPPFHVAACVAVVVVTAANAASDKLLYLSGVLPLAAGALASASRRIAATGVAVAVASFAGAQLVSVVMHAEHVRSAPYAVGTAPFGQLGQNLRYLGQSVAELFGGDIYVPQPSWRHALTVACMIALIAATGVAAVVILQARGTPGLERVHVAFWGASALLPALAFLFTTVGDYGDGRYLLSTGYGIVTLAVVGLARRRRAVRAAVAAAAAIVIAASSVALLERDLRARDGRQAFADVLQSVAEQTGATTGYAGYWNAAVLTWALRAQVRVYPVQDCTAAVGYCPPPFHWIGSWYDPPRHARTFLVTDRIFGPLSPDDRLGRPARVVTSGRDFTIYVYDHDITGQFGPPVTAP